MCSVFVFVLDACLYVYTDCLKLPACSFQQLSGPGLSSWGCPWYTQNGGGALHQPAHLETLCPDALCEGWIFPRTRHDW